MICQIFQWHNHGNSIHLVLATSRRDCLLMQTLVVETCYIMRTGRGIPSEKAGIALESPDTDISIVKLYKRQTCPHVRSAADTLKEEYIWPMNIQTLTVEVV